MTSPAAAHVSVNPAEWEAGGFARFAIRVPNERDGVATTEVTIQLPESVVSASFEPEPGWKRTVQMAPLDEPIEEEGEEPITERLASVTWSGGQIAPGEFVEFGISFQVPDTPGEELLFPALQTYEGGEVVRWIADDPEADTPAPRVTVLAAAEGGPSATETETETQASGADTEQATEGAATTDGRVNLALGLGAAGLLVGLAALAVSLARKPRKPPSS
jgi:periplasmic copper chaperone A